MKLLRLIGGLDPEHGGPPVSSLHACIAAQRAGAQTTFAFPVEGTPRGALADTLDRLRHEGIDIVHFPYAAGWGTQGESWGVSFDLSRWIRRNFRRYDIVHCHGAWQMVTYLMARQARHSPPLVLTPHESMTDFDIAQSSSVLTAALKKWLRRYYGNRFGRFVMSSRLEARDSLPDTAASQNRVAVIPHPVFDQSVAVSTTYGRNTAPEGLRLGYLGRLHEKKNVDLILRALQGLKPDITLTIAGSGPEADTLKALAQTLGIADRVRWSGFVNGNRKQDFFQAIDVLLMPSAYECFGMAAAEAMVQGIPVITTADTGIAEIIVAQGGGTVIAAETGALRAAIVDFVENPAKIVETGRQAANSAHKSLSFAAYGSAMTQHYESLLGDHNAAGP